MQCRWKCASMHLRSCLQVMHQETGVNVGKRLMIPFHGMGHVVVMDDFFISVELFEFLLSKGMYPTRTIQSHRGGIPKCLANKKIADKKCQGNIEWQRHESTPTQWMSGGKNKGDQGRRVTSVKSDGRESTCNVASPEARSCFHRP